MGAYFFLKTGGDSFRPVYVYSTFLMVVLLLPVFALPCAGTVPVEAPLLAHWSFDEENAGTVIADATGNAGNTAVSGEAVPRKRGVHGAALDLQGRHALRIASFGSPETDAITLSAWCRPTDLGGYREILRQESDHRLLFSFQNGGTVLALGLDIGGYIECDAAIEPSRVLDGGWHHCAGVADGAFMRVYLDGVEVGVLERAGSIALTPDAPAYIGSSQGENEHFQGRLDDLRVYAAALDAGQIAALYQGGRTELEVRERELEARAAGAVPTAPTFAETLSAMRRQALQESGTNDEEYLEFLAARLQRQFHDDAVNFAEWCGASPLAYIQEQGDAFHHERIGQLMDLLVEYRPLTDAQWAKQSPADRMKWEEADTLRQRYEELRGAGGAARFSPEWITLALEAGARIDFRPVKQEPVAPYITPQTPETRQRTPEEARTALEADWRHQAGGDFSPDAIRNEIRWARALAERVSSVFPDRVDFSESLGRLDALASQAMHLSGPDESLYFNVREVKRAIMFSNPVVDFERVLFVDMPMPQGSEWPHETRHRLGYMAVPGGKLVILEGLEPGGQVRQLMPQAPLHGSFWRPDVSWDAHKVLFCFKPHNEKSFHLYEINVDGTGLVQLTDGPYDDFDPIYLPDEGYIIFSTSRGNVYVRCMPPTNSFTLARCDRDGRNIYLISANNEPDYLPSVMNDGRVLYTRWEYTDKPLWRAQSLWTVNPDGTQSNTFWGNQSVWPDLLKDARAIPGSRRVMFTGSAHHNWFHGSVGIIDPNKGFNFPDGLTKVTADVEWPECGNGPVDPVESLAYHPYGKYEGFYSPYPLSEQEFVVSADRAGKFVLYLMDVDGNRELIYEGDNHILHAMPLRPRSVPPMIAERAQFPTVEERDAPPPGVIYSTNVYQNVPEVLRGKARYLRILNIDHKTYTYWHKRPYLSTGPVVSAVQSEGVKRIIGTVPIEADGSVSFEAPSGIPLHFQLLDEEQRALQTMRSFVNVMPGESRGCLGCHELHSRAPETDFKGAALARKPREITPPPWAPDTVSWARYVRPILDQYCASCHEGDGDAREVFDTTERPGAHTFTEPYLTMIGYPSWGAPYKAPENPPPGFGIAGQIMVEGYDTRDPAAYTTPEPMTALSYKSRLVELAASGEHYGVKVDETSRLRLIAWVDAMTPYLGEEEIRQMPDPEFQGVDWLAIRPRLTTAPEIVRPGPVELNPGPHRHEHIDFP